jgi:hypothetical protein
MVSKCCHRSFGSRDSSGLLMMCLRVVEVAGRTGFDMIPDLAASVTGSGLRVES